MPSGPLPPNPADLLSTGRFQEILAEVTSHFDIVIVDAPPVIGLADSLLLASVAGNVMFVVESGKTRTKAAVEALRMLGGTGAHILGATLTKSTDSGGGCGYNRYGYGYGYGYGKLDKKRTENSDDPAGGTIVVEGGICGLRWRPILAGVSALVAAAVVVRNAAVAAVCRDQSAARGTDLAVASFIPAVAGPDSNRPQRARPQAGCSGNARARTERRDEGAACCRSRFWSRGVEGQVAGDQGLTARRSSPPGCVTAARFRPAIFSPSNISAGATRRAGCAESRSSPE